jgi:hypothetical protein
VIVPSESGTQKKAVREQNAEEKQAAQKAAKGIQAPQRSVQDTAGETAAKTEPRAAKGEAKKLTGWTANISQVPNAAQNAAQTPGAAQNAAQTPRSAQNASQASRTPQRGFVPIYTLERQPVPLTREAPPDQPDDDFEFEFINIDND